MFKSVYKPKFKYYVLGTLVTKNVLNYFTPRPKLSSGSDLYLTYRPISWFDKNKNIKFF